MRSEGDFIKINEWLLPLSWLYGIGVRFRNMMFDIGILKSRRYDIPIISVGNITVGGSGKTPHVEYLISLLEKRAKVAVLSRGYKRKSRGYVLAKEDTAMRDIGDEPYQMKKKFGNIHIAVDKDRRHGIERLTSDRETKDTEVILLDDAYQHRYVKAGISILLVDYHRLIIYDRLLPAGRLREPQSGKSRADIVIVTKCPKDLKPMEYRVLQRAMGLYPYQKLFFTSIEYCGLKALFGNREMALSEIRKDTNILLLTGIASPDCDGHQALFEEHSSDDVCRPPSVHSGRHKGDKPQIQQLAATANDCDYGKGRSKTGRRRRTGKRDKRQYFRPADKSEIHVGRRKDIQQ